MSIDPNEAAASAAAALMAQQPARPAPSAKSGGAEGAFSDYLANAQGTTQAEIDAANAENARIAEMGFSKWVAKMQEEKRERMREELLRAMGLTEEDLENMPADQRQAIEDQISAEITKRELAEKQARAKPDAGEEPTKAGQMNALFATLLIR